MVKDMISQAATPLANAFARLPRQRRAGTGARPALQRRRPGVGGQHGRVLRGRRRAASGQRLLALLYNDKRSANNQDFRFTNPAAWAGFATRLRARRAAHLLGQRAGHQRPARRRRRTSSPSATPPAASRSASCRRATPAARPTASSTSRASTRATRAATSTASRPPARWPRTSARPIGDVERPAAGGRRRTTPTTAPARPARPRASSRSRAARRRRARYNGADGGERTGMSAR